MFYSQYYQSKPLICAWQTNKNEHVLKCGKCKSGVFIRGKKIVALRCQRCNSRLMVGEYEFSGKIHMFLSTRGL